MGDLDKRASIQSIQIFDHQVSDTVLRNERPEIPRDCPQPLAMIMKNCWLSKPSDRLSFGQVISQLENLDNI